MPEPSEQLSTGEANAPAASRRWLRRAFTWGGVFAACAATLVAFTPAILSAGPGRWLAAGMLGEVFAGDVEVGSVQLMWAGPQSISGVKVSSAEGGSLDCEAAASIGLVDLISGRLAGTKLSLRGDVQTTYDAAGALAIARLVKKVATADPKRGASTASPLDDLTLRVERFSFRATPDASVEPGAVDLAVRELSGSITLKSRNLALELRGVTVVGDRGGSLGISAKADGVLDATGTFGLPSSLQARVRAETLPIPAGGAPLEVESLDLSIDAPELTESAKLNILARLATPAGQGPARVEGALEVDAPMSFLGGAAAGAAPAIRGSLSLRELPTSLVTPYLGQTPIRTLRDIGPVVDADVQFDRLAVTARLHSEQVDASLRGTLDAEGARLALTECLVQASLHPELVAEISGARPSGALPVRFHGTRLAAPLQGPLADFGVDGTLTVAPSVFRVGQRQLTTGLLSADVHCARLADGLHMALSTSIDGLELKLEETGRNLLASNGDAIVIEGRIESGPVALERLGVFDAETIATLASLGLDGLRVQADHTGSLSRGSAAVLLRGATTSLDWSCEWDAASVHSGALTGTVAMSRGYLGGVTAHSVECAADLNAAVEVEPFTRSRAALTAGEVLPDQLVVGVECARVEVARARGLPAGAEVRDLVGTAKLSLSSDIGVSVQSSFGLTSRGGSEPTVGISAQVQTGSAAPDGAATVTVMAQVPAAPTLANLLARDEAAGLLTGPGKISLELRFPSEGPTIIASTVELPSVKGRGTLTSAPSGGMVIAPATLEAQVSVAFLQRLVSGDAPSVLQAFVAPPAAVGTTRLSANVVSLGWGDTGAGALDAALTLEPWSAALDGRGILRVGRTSVTLRTADPAKALDFDLSSAFALGESAAVPARVSAKLRGDLGRWTTKSQQPVQLSSSTVTVTLPGEGVEAIRSWWLGAGAATSPAPFLLSELGATIEIRSLTLRDSLSDAVADATLTLQPCTIRSGKDLAAQLGATTLAISAPESIGASTQLRLEASAQPTSGAPCSIQMQTTLGKLRASDGSLSMRGVELAANLNAKALPVQLVDVLLETDHALVESLGETVDIEAALAPGASGVAQGSLRAESPFLDIEAARLVQREGLLIVERSAPVAVELTVNPALRERVLRPLNPLLADIQDAKPLRLVVDSLALPLDGDMRRLDAHAVLTVGDVTIVKSDQILSLLKVFQDSAHPAVPARVEPLTVTIAKGHLSYDDWQVRAERMGEHWRYKLNLDGNIDLARTPIWADKIVVCYPLDSLARTIGGAAPGQGAVSKISDLLANTPLALLNILELEVIFSGPLGKVNGITVPLDTKVGATIGDTGPVIQQIGQSIGDLIRGATKK